MYKIMLFHLQYLVNKREILFVCKEAQNILYAGPKIVRMDPWKGAVFAGTTISATEKGGAPFELMECFDICRDMEDCGAFWIAVKYRH